MAVRIQHPCGVRCRSETGAPLSRAVRVGGVGAERGALRGGGFVTSARLRRAVPTGGRRSRACVPSPTISGEPPAALRAAVPAPTGRTGRRSAFQAVPALPLSRRFAVSPAFRGRRRAETGTQRRAAPSSPLRPGCRGAELNRRHKDFQSSALPSELPRLRAPAGRAGAVVWHSDQPFAPVAVSPPTPIRVIPP